MSIETDEDAFVVLKHGTFQKNKPCVDNHSIFFKVTSKYRVESGGMSGLHPRLP